ncbi:MAG: exodeoxyribonuclease VII small subunit [Akkermansiaceae bacterium]|jgi:exodeoxyribonuclease VII small subunit|nr:exodeoxyribonuclease VII small subunit [Akkermansiaceae bacterium]MDP4646806.1 exodeoxyribonuclease VII small subunit [Akkermansiaceae bacterium]MDP4719994.1 exodeoxyribonuclease VII small subunit [Akkermansiaceae bacterium]MDP4779722.1 exodeoxyribonuclease VII small subunit [Akkermansiaceae bacterium]MDP4846617.1 exodeoxyribonuclease VII small subunit [Akkermansiaceae bacterium]
MPSKKKTAPDAETEILPFEVAMAQLEDVVDAMEAEELPLEDLVSYYEKGSSLLKHCEKSLSSAKKRIELITLANKEEIPSENSSDEPSGSTNELSSEETDDQNDISLF